MPGFAVVVCYWWYWEGQGAPHLGQSLLTLRWEFGWVAELQQTFLWQREEGSVSSLEAAERKPGAVNAAVEVH